MVEKVFIILIVIAALYFIVRRLLHAAAQEPGAAQCEGCAGCTTGIQGQGKGSCAGKLDSGPLEHEQD